MVGADSGWHCEHEKTGCESTVTPPLRPVPKVSCCGEACSPETNRDFPRGQESRGFFLPLSQCAYLPYGVFPQRAREGEMRTQGPGGRDCLLGCCPHGFSPALRLGEHLTRAATLRIFVRERHAQPKSSPGPRETDRTAAVASASLSVTVGCVAERSARRSTWSHSPVSGNGDI